MKIKDTIVSPIAPNTSDVMWLDTSDAANPVLKAFVNGSFIPVDGLGYYAAIAESVPITTVGLRELRDAGSLKAGQLYRITDYECITVQDNTSSAGHIFDIIVMANDEHTLNDNAWAAHHEGDTYFADSNLAAWELKYSLDTDAKYSWAKESLSVTCSMGTFARDESYDNPSSAYPYGWFNGMMMAFTASETPAIGDTMMVMNMMAQTITGVHIPTGADKGVIYYMKDEFNNECPYDFKNILYTVTINNEEGTYYTFSVLGPDSISYIDGSVSGQAQEVAILPKKNLNGFWQLGNNVFRGDGGTTIYFERIQLGTNCYNNVFLNKWTDILLGTNCYNNSFGASGGRFIELKSGCYNNDIISASYIELGANCASNKFGGEAGVSSNRIKLGAGCAACEFGNCGDIIVGQDSFQIIIPSSPSAGKVSIGRNASNITITGQVYGLTIGDSCNRITLNWPYGVSIGNSCSDITLGANAEACSIGNECNNITTGRNCEGITIGDYCNHITFGNSEAVKDYYKNIIVENGNQYIYLYCSATTSSNSPYRNVLVGLGVNNTTTWKTITDSNVNQTVKTTYEPSNSQVINV